MQLTSALAYVHLTTKFDKPGLLPDDGVFRGLVLGLALHADQLDPGGVQGRRDANLDLLGQ